MLASLERLQRHAADPDALAGHVADAGGLGRSAGWRSCAARVVGFFVGILPGAGPTIAAIIAYVAERRFSRHPERFGKGALDAVAAAESANNSAGARRARADALARHSGLGLHGGAARRPDPAGHPPGPDLMTEQPDLVWGLIASMFIGNVMLLVMNLPLAPVFASILRIPYVYLAPGILMISLVGAYAATNSFFTVIVALVFGVIGWFMIKLDFPRAPLVLALVLAPMMETSLRQSLLLSYGSPMIFVERPFSAVLLLLVVVSLALPAYGAMRRHLDRAPKADAV